MTVLKFLSVTVTFKILKTSTLKDRRTRDCSPECMSLNHFIQLISQYYPFLKCQADSHRAMSDTTVIALSWPCHVRESGDAIIIRIVIPLY